MNARSSACCLHRVIRSRLEAVDAVCREVRSFLSANGLTSKSFAVELLTRESLNNAVLHGNRKQAAKKASLELRLGRRWLRLQITDEGPGFNWRKVRAAGIDVAAVSGRGLLIARHYADRVSFNHQGSQITLWLDKNRNSKRN